ncbi:MAG: PKD domain-containing protein [Bacteroidota bacterium]
MFKLFFIVLIFIFFTIPCYCQLFDNTWFFGYDNNLDTTDEYGISTIAFYDGIPIVKQNNKFPLNLQGSNSSISDSIGNFIFCTNGVKVCNSNSEIINNSNFFMNDNYEESGFIFPQCVVSIPYPGHEKSYLILYLNYSYSNELTFYATGIYTSTINFENNNSGELMNINETVLKDSLRLGHLAMVKHANGRDWWMIVNKINTNIFYRVLVSPLGAKIIGTQVIGIPIYDGVGQSLFSPDGTHFCSFNDISQTDGSYLDIYNFDRCTGLLSNHRQLHQNEGLGGVAVSPNSRYLYHNFEFEVYQYDLDAPDVLASKVKVADWDGYQSPFPAAFYLMQLAPDGKIYAASPTGVDVLHVIHQPDEPGVLCQYEQHGIHLPTYNSFSIPISPNYRLGPLDGSSCDTLGIDNRPVAWFRYQRDTLDSLSVLFHDLSYYEPTSWSWDFGDGTPLSAERHPAHTYAQAGAYEVCLTVSNANATNTFCRKLFLGVTAAEDPDIQASISVFPNPFNTRLGVAESGALRVGLFRLFDLSGRLKRETALVPGIREIDTGDLAAGMYFWEVRVKGERVASGKLVKNIE